MSAWPQVQLGDVCKFINGGTPRKDRAEYFSGSIPWITSADIDKPVAYTARSFITQEAIVASATNQVPEGTVLLVTRTSVGKVAITGRAMCFNQDICAVIPDSVKMLAEYLGAFLKTKEDYFKKNARGATIKGITRELVERLSLALPPISEQRRIAAILDQAETLRTQRREALAQLDALAQSVFVEMFGEPGNNKENWPIGVIKDLLSSASYGTSEKSSSEGAYPVLRMNNITKTGQLNLGDLKYMNLSVEDIARYTVIKGDVLFNRTNSPELVGKSAVFRFDKPMAYAGYLIRLRAGKNCDPEYLGAFLNTPYIKTKLRSMCKSIIGMANINAKEIQAMQIAMPPLALQQEFATRIQAIESLKHTHRAALAELDALFASLQHRAFAGQL